jgi:nucleotide-binding universal stress UspA family protein
MTDETNSPREQLESLAKVGESVSAAWVLQNLEAIVGDRFDLPRLTLSPMHPLDVEAEHEALLTAERERAKALKPAPGAKPTRKAESKPPTEEITVN